MKRILAILTVIIVAAGIFSGCGNTAAQDKSAATVASSVGGSTGASTVGASTEGNVFPLKVKDANGFEMTLQKQPVKIVSLTLGTDEMLLGLIDKSRIASVTPYAVDTGVSNVAVEAKDIPNEFLSKDAEKIIALQPDLIFVDTWADPNFVKQMRDAGLTVYVFKTPSNITAQESTVKEIAHVVGADEKGTEIVSWMEEQLNAVSEKIKGLKDSEKLSVLDYSEMGTTSGKGTNTDDIFNRAGIVNVAAKAGLDGWPQVNKEQIVEWDPDVILLPGWFYDNKNSLQGMKDTLKSDKSLAGVTAIKNDRMITVPYQHISAISQYVVLSVKDLAEAVYPELFK